MGELHLEVLRNRLERDFKLKVKVHKPRVSYRETVRSAAVATGEYRQSRDGDSQFADVTVRVEPFTGDEAVTLKNELKPGDLPQDMRKVLDEAIRESTQSGGLIGYPLMNVRFVVTDVTYKESETTEDALRAAASHAVHESLTKADAALLEPVMKLEVTTPPEFVGNIQADLNSRHAIIVGSEPRGHLTIIQAHVPLARMFGYSTQVRSLSQGRASYSMEPLKYDLAPPSVLEEMMR